mmetsp:Transcript_74929/g.109889  ORF Transcript_74929/g.109889 Transcript_74929/m.109889 type:complete len:100 (+) Transcript_74929:40-339(+)
MHGSGPSAHAKAAHMSLATNEFAAGVLSGPVLKLVGQRWRPRTLVLEPHPSGKGGGHLWWYSEADGAEYPKGSLPLEKISACLNSALGGVTVRCPCEGG